MSPPIRRRGALRQGAALGAAATLGLLAGSVFAQADDLASYRAAKINWKQAEGETITVAVIPASYFENLISLQPQFEALTGVKLRFEKVPPGQIRQKALLAMATAIQAALVGQKKPKEALDEAQARITQILKG